MESKEILEQKDFAPLLAATERILSKAWNNRINISKVECLTEKGRRNLLLRCFICPVDGVPSSFIIKKVKAEIYHPDRVDLWDTRRFFNDWIGSQFLNSLPSKFKHSPFFYGGDRYLGLIAIEDVQHQDSLVEPLLGRDRTTAESALLKYVTCLANLHTNTLGKLEEFEQLYRTLSPNMNLTRVSVNIHHHKSRLENLGIRIESNWIRDLEAIHQTVRHPGEFSAYIHTDACPDNVLNTGQELRLIDFETGFFGHALIDAVGSRMMFPSCWCSKRLPDAMVRQMENAYRKILVQHCSSAADDNIFETALVHTCGLWVLDTLSRHFKDAIEKDEDFGICTIRQRIMARLEVFIATSREFNRLPGLRNSSSRLLDLLRQRWSEIPDLPLYPAFLNE